MSVSPEKVTRKAARDLLERGQAFLAERISKLDRGDPIEEVMGGSNVEAMGVNVACDESCNPK